MRVYVVTDMEGVAGVSNFADWCLPSSPNYDLGCRYLTEEVNAAVTGFFAAGATHITVLDGHGPGAIDTDELNNDVRYLRVTGSNPYPFGIDEGFDVMAWVGQHAMAGTPYGHIPHTGNFNVADYRINGKPVGEFAQLAMCGALYGTVPIFGSGDEAFVREAKAFDPMFIGVTVKRGLDPTTGDGLDEEAAKHAWTLVEHKPRKDVLNEIRSGAERALTAFDGKRQPSALPDTWERSVYFRNLNEGRNVRRLSNYSGLLSLLNDTEDVV